ncbi:MAG: PAS domain S-box protein, partial [Methanoregula sp.]|nr:PAS domain S-box protein [Methanoregula sp.]
MMAAAIRVLYVDDDPRLLDLCKVFLEKSGDFAVTTALSAPDAIRLLEQERFDAIISDYQMPDMDGIKFLKQIKANGNKTPFIIITGKGYEKVVIAALNAGADGYFQKSGEPKLHFAELSQKIKKAVESRRVEEALVESEERFRTLVASVNEVIILQEKTGEILTWNRAAERLFGVTSREVLGHTATSWKWKTIREDGTDFPDAEHPSMHTLATGEACKNVVMGITSAEGRFTWVNINTSPLFKQGDANPYAVVISLLDITDRKRAVEGLRESEEKYRMLVETLNEGIWVIDKDAVTTYVNPKMADILGYTVEEIIGRSLFAFVDDEGRRSCEQNIERRKQGIKEQHDFEFLKKDGTRIYTSLETSAIKGKDGKYLGAIAGVMDITERKRAQEALRNSEERYRNVVEDQTELICRFLPDGTHIFVNEAYCRYFDRKRGEIIGHRFKPVLHPEDREIVARHIASLTSLNPVMNIDQRIIMS